MHRSGTSAITNVLEAGGLYCGKSQDLLPADQWNQKGYFERNRLVELNEALLYQHFLSYANEYPDIIGYQKSNPDPREGWILGSLVSVLKRKAIQAEETGAIGDYVNLLYKESETGQSIVLKDPRLSITLPVWLGYLKNVVVIVAVRNPAEVAQSLYAREQLPRSASRLLWEIYTKSAVQASKGLRRIVIDYSNLIENPESSVNRLFDFLKNNGIDDLNDDREQAIKCIDPALHHNKPVETDHALERIFDYQARIYRRIAMDEHLDAVLANEELPEQQGDELALSSLGTMMKILNDRREIAELTGKLGHCYQKLDRVNNHIVAGSVIRFLRMIKRDKTFGR
jgi:hypothetical protein